MEEHPDRTALAASETAADIYRGYFTDFLPGFLNQLLIEDLRSLDTAFSHRILDSDRPPWTLTIRQGCLVEIREGLPVVPCCFVSNAQTFLDIISAQVAPQEAFFAKRIEVEGDIETGMRLSFALAPFFQRYPYSP